MKSIRGGNLEKKEKGDRDLVLLLAFLVESVFSFFFLTFLFPFINSHSGFGIFTRFIESEVKSASQRRTGFGNPGVRTGRTNQIHEKGWLLGKTRRTYWHPWIFASGKIKRNHINDL